MKNRIFALLIGIVIGTTTANILCNALTAKAEGVIIDTGNQNIDRFVYELTEWVSDNINGTIENIEDLSNSGIMQKIDMIGSTSLFAYYLTDYYNTHAVGSGLFEPQGSAISGVYRVEGDDTLYSASAFTLSSYNGMLINSLHYAMQIDLEAVNYDPNITYTIDQLVSSVTPIQNNFEVGCYFPVNGISNTSVRIHYNGSGLFNSSTWLQGATSQYRIVARIEPNAGIPVITQGYNWGSNGCFCTHYGTGFFSLPESVNPTSDTEPWNYYNNSLLPQLLEKYPDLIPDDFPFHGEPFRPATVTDPTEPETTRPRYELETVPDLWQPVTEIIEITNDSSEVIETQIETVTDTNGQPISEPKMPKLPTIPIDVEPFPDWFIPLDLWDTIAGIWEAMRNTMEETELLNLLPFVMIVGLVGFGLKYIGG